MIAGHAPLAFAIAAAGAAALGHDARRALAFGVLAAAFAVVPDVDMVYAVVGLALSGADGVWTATAAFWESSRVVHRAVTHSLVVAVPAALGFALAADRGPRRAAGGVLLAVLVLGSLATSGPLAGAMLSLYALAGVAVASTAARTGFGGRSILAAALVGLLSHPFGDVFTGEPPHLLYPVDVHLLDGRIVLATEPTLNLLAIFGVELLAIWLAVVVGARLTGVSLPGLVDWRAAAGAGYGLAAVVMPAPTLEVSYHFVVSVLAVGTVGVAPLSRRRDRTGGTSAAITALLAVTLAVLAYAGAYVLT